MVHHSFAAEIHEYICNEFNIDADHLVGKQARDQFDDVAFW